MIKTNVKGVQEAKAAMKKAIEDFMSDKFVTVGIHEDAGAREDGVTNAQIGAVNHFGGGNTPARPWLDIGVMKGVPLYSDVIRSVSESGENLDMALNRIGILAVTSAQEYITELNSPANAPSTVAKKGSANPLIDTGILRSSVSYKITATESEEGIS
jgi:hypothetical protein